MRLLSALTLFLSLAVQADDKVRDLSKYDVIGPFNIDYVGSKSQEGERLQGKVREFLWTHWREHRLARVSATYRYVITQKGRTRITYFVEPDKQGQWVVLEYSGNPSSRKNQPFSCGEVVRVEREWPRFPLPSIPDSEPREPEKYLLHPVCADWDRLW